MVWARGGKVDVQATSAVRSTTAFCLEPAFSSCALVVVNLRSITIPDTTVSLYDPAFNQSLDSDFFKDSEVGKAARSFAW